MRIPLNLGQSSSVQNTTAPNPTAPTQSQPATPAPAQAAPEGQPASSPGDSSHVQSIQASSHEPKQVDFGLGASLGAAIGGAAAALFGGAPSKSVATAGKYITNSNLDDRSLEKSVARTMADRQGSGGRPVDTRASSGPQQSAPGPEASGPAVPTTPTPQPARPDRPAEDAAQE